MMKRVTRRTFVKGAAVCGAALAASRHVLGSNDAIRVGVAGINGRGGTLISEFNKLPGVRVVALCDVDRNVLERRAKSVEGAATYVDAREMIASKDVDVIGIATTNHTHALLTFWACQAGKDVYVEKPLSHNVFEGRQIVEAARKYKCIVQHGTQNRASGGWAKTAAAARSGKFGKLLVAKGYCCKGRWSIGCRPIAAPPAHVDFNLWLGPARLQPYHANLVHYNWHWFWDFGNGDMGNQGVHQIDICRWGIPDGTLPRGVVSVGGRYVNEPGFKDQGETPNQIVSIFDYGESLVLFETRGLVGRHKEYPDRVDNEFYTTEGVLRNNRFHPYGKTESMDLGDVPYAVQPGGIFGNFIVCVRSRRQADLNADVLEGHLSSALCHLGNISYVMGVDRKFEAPKDLGDNQVVGDSIMTMLENTKAIGVNVENAMLRVGPKLAFDPAKEKFIDNPAADALLTRPYRAPFVVTEEV